jgi:anti-sigma B factor antagonist
MNGSRLGVAIKSAGDEACVVAVTGELDLNTIPQVESRLFKRLRSHAGVVIDLRRLDFIDSSGIGLLIKAHQADGAPIHTVVASGSQVDRVFTLTRIDRALPIFTDVEAALRSFEPDGRPS